MTSRSTLATWLGSLDASRLARVLGARKDAVSPPEPRSVGELAGRLQRPGSVALVLPRFALPHLQVAEALAALGAPASRDALAGLLGAADDEPTRELEAVLEALADHALVWPDGTGKLCMAGPLRHAWDKPLGLDAPLEELLAGTTSEELRRMLAALGVKSPGTKPQRLATLAAHRKLAKLGLRQLAPTVLISRSPLDTTVAALRAEGYAPVAETAEGTVRVEKARPRRGTAPVPPPRGTNAKDKGRIAATRAAKASAAIDCNTLAAQLLAAPPTISDPAPFDGGVPFATDTEEIVAGWAKHLPYGDVRQLAHAIDTGRAITVEYVASSGSRTVRTLSRLMLDPPYLEAWCHLRDAERVFTLSRVHSVMSVPEREGR
jgi:hypothetical protein